MALAAAFALAVLATNFPLPTLLSQHHQLSAEAAQLHQVQSSNRALSEQNQQLNSTAEIDRLARQDYQLVLPNQTLYNVLPPSGKTTSTTPGRSTSGDPGDQPLVSPADAPDMSPDPGLPRTPSASGSAGAKRGTNGADGSATGGSVVDRRVGNCIEPVEFLVPGGQHARILEVTGRPSGRTRGRRRVGVRPRGGRRAASAGNLPASSRWSSAPSTAPRRSSPMPRFSSTARRCPPATGWSTPTFGRR